MNELRQAEEHGKKAMTDAARMADELRQEQEHAGQIEKLRRALEGQVKELQVKVDEAEAAALHGGRKAIQSLEQRVRQILSSLRSLSSDNVSIVRLHAMQCTVLLSQFCLSVCLFFCPSVRPSVTRVDCHKTK